MFEIVLNAQFRAKASVETSIEINCTVERRPITTGCSIDTYELAGKNAKQTCFVGDLWRLLRAARILSRERRLSAMRAVSRPIDPRLEVSIGSVNG